MNDVNVNTVDKQKETAAHPRLQEFLFSAKRFLKNPLTIIGLVIILFFGFEN